MRTLIIAVLLATGLALAACGGDGGAGDGRLSAAEYRAQVTQLCTESAREVEQIGGIPGVNASALAQYFDAVSAVLNGQRQKFERLRPPADLRDEHSQVAPLLAAETEAAKQAALGFRSGADPVATFDTYKKDRNKALRRQGKLLRKMKLTGCRSDAGAGGGAAGGSS